MLESAIDNLSPGDDGCDFNVFTVYPRDDTAFPKTEHVTLFNGSPAALIFRIIPFCLVYRLLSSMGVRMRREFQAPDLKALVLSDAVLIIGGTTFSDAQLFKIPYNAACLLPAIILGKRSMMYSQTMGPMKKGFNRAVSRHLLSKITKVVARGSGSLENVLDLGLKNAVYFTDSAFTLKVPDETVRRIRELYAPMLEGRKVVGISVNSIVEGKCKKLGIDHNGSFAALIEYLRERGYFILMVPHSMRIKSRLRHNNDLYTVDDIMKRLSSTDGIHIVREPYDCKELRVVVGLADYYVASRFHSMISALCSRVPVVVFDWGFQKYREVLEEFGLERYCRQGRELSGDNLISGFEDVVAHGKEIIKKIDANMPRVVESSMKMHETARKMCMGETGSQSMY